MNLFNFSSKLLSYYILGDSYHSNLQYYYELCNIYMFIPEGRIQDPWQNSPDHFHSQFGQGSEIRKRSKWFLVGVRWEAHGAQIIFGGGAGYLDKTSVVKLF